MKNLILALITVAMSPALAGNDRESADIPPGKIHESCMTLVHSDTLAYEFSADKPLEFNLHYHPGEVVEYPIPVMLTEEEKGTFQPGTDHKYCLMWKNSTREIVRLTYSWSVESEQEAH